MKRPVVAQDPKNPVAIVVEEENGLVNVEFSTLQLVTQSSPQPITNLGFGGVPHYPKSKDKGENNHNDCEGHIPEMQQWINMAKKAAISIADLLLL